MTYMQKIVNQTVNILMRTKLDMNLNRNHKLKSHFPFLSITWVFEKVLFHSNGGILWKFLVCYDLLSVRIKEQSEDPLSCKSKQRSKVLCTVSVVEVIQGPVPGGDYATCDC